MLRVYAQHDLAALSEDRLPVCVTVFSVAASEMVVVASGAPDEEVGFYLVARGLSFCISGFAMLGKRKCSQL